MSIGSAAFRRRLRVAGLVLVVVSMSIAMLAWALILAVDVETVLGSGPALFIAGIALLVIACIAANVKGILLGAAHMGICLLFVILVNLLHWSPGDAEMPFLLMGVVHLIATGGFSYFAFVRWPQPAEPWQCQACLYPLYGLTNPHCPECGHAFDPRTVPPLPGHAE